MTGEGAAPIVLLSAPEGANRSSPYQPPGTLPAMRDRALYLMVMAALAAACSPDDDGGTADAADGLRATADSALVVVEVAPADRERVEAAEALVAFLRGEAELDMELLGDTVTLHVAPEGGGQTRSVAREALRDTRAWSVGRNAMTPASESLTEFTTLPGAHLNCIAGDLADRSPALASRPHVGAMLRPPGAGSCLQAWSMTFVFTAGGPPVVTDVLYDQWEW